MNSGMVNALLNALVPIFAGLMLGWLAGRQGVFDNVHVHDLIALVMDFAVPCAMFSVIMATSRHELREQILTSFVIALGFAALYLGCYLWARRKGMSIADAAVLALTFGFPNSAAVAVVLLSDVFGKAASVPAALSIAVGSVTLSPITLALLESGADTNKPKITARTLSFGVFRSLARPVVWAPILALLCVCIGVHLASYGLQALRTLGGAATGSALLLTGVVISAQRFRLDAPVILLALAKLVLQPLLALGIALLFRMEHDLVRDIVLICAIPGGFFGLVFGKAFNATPQTASSGLIATYALAVITLPLWILILTRFV
jgi:predicted permease